MDAPTDTHMRARPMRAPHDVNVSARRSPSPLTLSYSCTRTAPPPPSSAPATSLYGLTPTYQSYHSPYSRPDHQPYIFPPSVPIVSGYQSDQRLIRPLPGESHTSSSRHPILPFVRPLKRELPRIDTRPDSDQSRKPGNAYPNSAPYPRVFTRPLVAKNRPDNTPDKSVYHSAGPYAASDSGRAYSSGNSQLVPLTKPRMDSPTRTHSVVGKKRKTSFDGDAEQATDVKTEVEELDPESTARYRTEDRHGGEDEQVIIPGVALNVNGSSASFTHQLPLHRPSLASRPSGSNVSLSSSPGRASSTPNGHPGFSNRQSSIAPRGVYPSSGVLNGTINPNAKGLGGDGQGPSFPENGYRDSGNNGTSEHGQGDKAKRKKPRVALSCAQCTKVSLVDPFTFSLSHDCSTEKAKV